jgi:hypothetical protein
MAGALAASEPKMKQRPWMLLLIALLALPGCGATLGRGDFRDLNVDLRGGFSNHFVHVKVDGQLQFAADVTTDSRYLPRMPTRISMQVPRGAHVVEVAVHDSVEGETDVLVNEDMTVIVDFNRRDRGTLRFTLVEGLPLYF